MTYGNSWPLIKLQDGMSTSLLQNAVPTAELLKNMGIILPSIYSYMYNKKQQSFEAVFPAYAWVGQQLYTSPYPSHLPFLISTLSCPFPPPGSMSSSAFPIISYLPHWHDLFHPIIIILLQHVPTILTYSVSRYETLIQSPFFPSVLHSALYSSSPYIPISHSAPLSWPTFHSSHMSHTASPSA